MLTDQCGVVDHATADVVLSQRQEVPRPAAEQRILQRAIPASTQQHMGTSHTPPIAAPRPFAVVDSLVERRKKILGYQQRIRLDQFLDLVDPLGTPHHLSCPPQRFIDARFVSGHVLLRATRSFWAIRSQPWTKPAHFPLIFQPVPAIPFLEMPLLARTRVVIHP